MKVNKIEWGTCPHCKTMMNGFQFYPAQIIMQGASDVYIESKCPKCKEPTLVACKVTVEFTIEDGKETSDGK